jgi:hypothetical protein
MVEEFEPREVPDWPAELAEPVARLGPPSDVFHIPRRRAARKAIYGLGLIAGGGLANYLYWVVFNGPVVAEHLLFLFLFGPIISGIGLIYAAWRDSGLWALVYPMGLLRWQRGEVVTFPWEDVSELVFYRVVECDRPNRTTGPEGELTTSWLPIAKMGSRTLGAHLILRREDGAEAILPSTVNEFTRLCRIVQEETFRAMWPRVAARFADGLRVNFGELALSLAGIHREADLLAWYNLDDAIIQNGKLIIRSKRLHRAWQEVPLHSVTNPHVFAALLLIGPPEETED